MVAIAIPLGAAPGARADIGLLDAPPIHVDLGERTPIAILPVRLQHHFTG